MLSTLLLLWIACAPVEAEPGALAELEARLTPLAGATPAHWRVVWTEAPATRATVSWSTAVAGGESLVFYDTSPHGGALEDYAKRAAAVRNGRYTRDDEREPEAWYHHARLEGLAPWTTYFFVVVTDGEASRELHFKTARAGDGDFSVLHGGDSRTGHLERCRMNGLIAALTDEHEDLIAFLHGGDFVMTGTSWAQWRAWLSHAELAVGDAGRVLPIVPTRGNHDFGPLFDEIFDAPGGAELNYYATQLSDQVALLTLNTNISAGGDQRDWLEAHLSAFRPSARWMLAQYHAPFYPAVKTPDPAKPHWVPLFEQYDLDLSLESDGHCIKRTVPIREERYDARGVVYIGEGGLGVPQRTPRSGLWYFEPPGLVSKGHHVNLLDLGREGLRIRTFLLGDTGFDASGFEPLVPRAASWSFLAGRDPAPEWVRADYDDTDWSVGRAGFGFGLEGDATVLAGMHRSYTRVYLRHSVELAALEQARHLALVVDYDDGFIAYLNGHEVCRRGIDQGRGAEAARADVHVAGGHEYLRLEGWREFLEPGTNVLAIEAHNSSRIGRTFRIDPFLIGNPLPAETATTRPAREAFDDHTLQPRR